MRTRAFADFLLRVRIKCIFNILNGHLYTTMLEEVGEIMAKRALFPGWKVVLGAGVGIAFGSLVIFASGFAILAAAMAPQFGRTQPEVAKAASIFLLVQTLTFPFCRWPLDTWGSRRVAIA